MNTKNKSTKSARPIIGLVAVLVAVPVIATIAALPQLEQQSVTVKAANCDIRTGWLEVHQIDAATTSFEVEGFHSNCDGMPVTFVVRDADTYTVLGFSTSVASSQATAIALPATYAPIGEYGDWAAFTDVDRTDASIEVNVLVRAESPATNK